MKIEIWIASTTHIDRQNEKMSKECLEWMAEQINSKYIPQLIEHNFDNQVWVLLYWEVFWLPDWEFALWVVFWIFESEKDENIYKNYEKNLVFSEYKKHFNKEKLIKLFLFNKIDTEESNIENIDNSNLDNIALLLEKYFNKTNVTLDWKVYFVKHFIAETNNLKIEIYPKDHFPEHFHIRSKDRKLNARFDLNTYEYISTKNWKITDKQIKQIKSFLENNPKIAELLKTEYIRLQW